MASSEDESKFTIHSVLAPGRDLISCLPTHNAEGTSSLSEHFLQVISEFSGPFVCREMTSCWMICLKHKRRSYVFVPSMLGKTCINKADDNDSEQRAYSRSTRDGSPRKRDDPKGTPGGGLVGSRDSIRSVASIPATS